MIRLRPWFHTLAVVVLFIGLVPFLAGCGSTDKEEFVAWEPSTTDQLENTPPPDRSSRSTSGPPGVREEETPNVFSTPRAAAAIPAGKLTPNDLKTLQPNEIGWIPVMEYHAITTDPAKESDQFVRTAAHLREDL